jgi:hypothetical protein
MLSRLRARCRYGPVSPGDHIPPMASLQRSQWNRARGKLSPDHQHEWLCQTGPCDAVINRLDRTGLLMRGNACRCQSVEKIRSISVIGIEFEKVCSTDP